MMNKNQKKEENKISRGMIGIYLGGLWGGLQGCMNLEGLNGETMLAIIENIVTLSNLTRSFQLADQELYKRLHTPAVEQAESIIQSMTDTARDKWKTAAKESDPEPNLFESPWMSVAEQETYSVNQKIVDAFNRELGTLRNDYYSKEIEMPKLERISRGEFAILLKNNIISNETYAERVEKKKAGGILVGDALYLEDIICEKR